MTKVDFFYGSVNYMANFFCDYVLIFIIVMVSIKSPLHTNRKQTVGKGFLDHVYYKAPLP